jgi:hypothetical protein
MLLKFCLSFSRKLAEIELRLSQIENTGEWKYLRKISYGYWPRLDDEYNRSNTRQRYPNDER